MRATMRIRLKTVVLSLVVLLLLVVLGGITAVGWQVVLGPDARPIYSGEVRGDRGAAGARQVPGRGPRRTASTATPSTTSRNPEYPIIQAKKGAGWVMPIPELNNIAARNITPDPETGIGTWTDDEIARAIREGVRKDGTALFPVMPYLDFASLDDEDVKSIVVYLRTIPAVKNTVPDAATARSARVHREDDAEAADDAPAVASRGDAGGARRVSGRRWRLAAAATPSDGRRRPCRAWRSPAAEVRDPGLDKTVFTANITPDPSGIAHYDESLFIQTLRTGQMARPDAEPRHAVRVLQEHDR